MNILLLNDTEEVYHWGCYGTSHAIKMQLQQKGATHIESISVDDVRRLRGIPERADGFGTETRFSARYPALAGQLAACDMVVINGEGTIHGFRNAPRALLYLAYAAKHFFQKPVALINHACFPKYHRPEVIEYYHAGYASCAYVAARDGRSTNTIRETLGVACVHAFDSLPLSIREVAGAIPEPATARPFICLAGAANYSVVQSPAIARVLTQAYPSHAVIFLVGSRRGGRLFEDRRAFNSLKRYLPTMQWMDATSFPAWLSHIKHADLLLSGRFHYTIAAACLGTPAVTFQSNTAKNDSLFEDLGLPGAIPRVPEFWEHLGKPRGEQATVAAFETALRERIALQADTQVVPRLAECCERALRNYAWNF